MQSGWSLQRMALQDERASPAHRSPAAQGKETPHDILMAGFHFSHLGEDAGYDRLARYMPAEYADADAMPMGKASFGSLAKPLNLLLLDLSIIPAMRRYRVVHYLHAENHLFVSSHFAGRAVTVGTVHLTKDFITDTTSEHPRKRLIKLMRRRAFDRLNGIIVLGSQDIRHYEQAFPRAVVGFVPHGVSRLRPEPSLFSEKKPLRIAVVGANYRDEELWCEVVQEALRRGKPWTFELVGAPKAVKDRLRGLANTVVHPYLSDEEYRTVLASCNVLFLPLSFATANNALLEAHSVGLPAIVSDVHGARDYALPSTAFCQGAGEALARLEEVEAMSVEAENGWRKETFDGAKAFHWDEVAKKVLRFYDEAERCKAGA